MQLKTLIKRRAITLIEALLAIAVGAAVIIGAVIFYMSATGQSQYNNAQSQVQGVIANTRSYFRGFGSYTGLTNSIAINARIFPSSMITGTTASPLIRNPWGGSVTLVDSAAGATFSITLTRIPQDSCGRLISQNTSGMGGAMVSLSVNGTVQTLPLTPAAVATACSVATAAGNTIIWEVQ